MRREVAALAACGVLWFGAPDVSEARSTLGGIIFTDFYLQTLDSEASSIDESTSETRVELPGITRLRGLWTNEDDVEMFIELGIGGESGSTTVRLRHAFGKWDFSSTGQLMAGHSTSPFSPLFPSQAIGNNADESHNVGKGYGEVSSGRAPQLRYTYKFLNSRGAFAIALLDPNRDDEIDAEIGGVKSATIPRIDIGLAYRAYNWQLFPSIFYQSRQYDGAVLSEDEVDSWGASFGFRGGRAQFLFSGEVNVGGNMRNANLGIGQSAAAVGGGAFTFTDTSGQTRLGDVDNLGWWFDLGYKFTVNELQGVVHLVVGQMTSERDGGAEVESSMIGLSVPIDLPWLAKGFRVRFEAFAYENDNNGNTLITAKDGTEIISGVQLQYTF